MAVYFVLDPTRLAVKIGHASDVTRRVGQLQTANGSSLILLGCVPGHSVAEKCLHDLLARWRVRGEWFQYNHFVAKIVGLAISSGLPAAHEVAEQRRVELSYRDRDRSVEWFGDRADVQQVKSWLALGWSARRCREQLRATKGVAKGYAIKVVGRARLENDMRGAL